MKNKMDKLKSRIKTNKKFTVFLVVLVIVGVILGSFFITILSNSDKTLIKEYLNNYMKVVKTGKFDYLPVFLNSLLNGGITAFAIWMLGISIVGIPVILFLFFCKAFTLGFSIGSMFFVYGWKGSILSLSYLFPHQVIILVAYGILTIYALSVSIKMIEAVFKKKTIDFRAIMGKYSMILGISIGFLLISSLLETFFMPNMMKWVLSFLQ